MNYLLSNFQIKEVTGGNRISGQNPQKYLSASTFNPLNALETAHKLVVFDQDVVARYAQHLPKKFGGVLEDEGWSEDNMPQAMKLFLNGTMETYPLGGQFARKYTSDIIDANGQPVAGKRAGDWIRNRAGEIMVYTELQVFCQYQFVTEPMLDEYGMPIIKDGIPLSKPVRGANGELERRWCPGMSPAEVGESLKTLLFPYQPEPVVNNTSIDNFDGTAQVNLNGQQQQQQSQQQQQQTAPPQF